MINLLSVYRLNDVFTEARRNGTQLHRVVENHGGICERELKTFQKHLVHRRTYDPHVRGALSWISYMNLPLP